MREIRVFYDNTGYTLRWLRSLVWAKKEFQNAGYKIVFDSVQAPIPSLYKILKIPKTKDGFLDLFSKKRKYDIVFLAYHHSHEFGLCALSKEDRASVLTELKKKCNKLVWLDTSDSTGTCFFDVLPYVDVYLKKQRLSNLKDYTKEFYGGRIWCDYYHSKYKIDDIKLEKLKYSVLDCQYEDKIGISWNVGMGDLFTKTHWQKIRYRNRYAPFVFSEPSINRHFDVHYRGSTSDTLALYQRNKVIELLAARNDLITPDITKKVPYLEYISETKNSRVVISPFGWGEICGRDFESFMHGAAMLKMDMSHMITYPNWYQAGVTYISVDWDFENFQKTIDYLLTNEGKQKALEIARNGQEMYKKYLTSKEKKNEFVQHVLLEIKELR